MNSTQPCIGYLPSTIRIPPRKQCSTSCSSITPIGVFLHARSQPNAGARRRRRDAFTAALGRVSAAGATIVDLPMAEFAQAAAVNPRGALTSAEVYWWHRQWIKDGADKYDPGVIVRELETTEVRAATG
jgi:Asp-tRNA(Asn)/Glu-tRNA(Gln) amidotransferase A subunit family amidase